MLYNTLGVTPSFLWMIFQNTRSLIFSWFIFSLRNGQNVVFAGRNYSITQSILRLAKKSKILRCAILLQWYNYIVDMYIDIFCFSIHDNFAVFLLFYILWKLHALYLCYNWSTVFNNFIFIRVIIIVRCFSVIRIMKRGITSNACM